jgi:hypothetical protein
MVWTGTQAATCITISTIAAAHVAPGWPSRREQRKTCWRQRRIVAVQLDERERGDPDHKDGRKRCEHGERSYPHQSPGADLPFGHGYFLSLMRYR